MKLELGSGDRPFEDGSGWVHLDERPLPDIEFVASADDLTQTFAANSIETIRAAHLLEHFSWTKTVDVLKTWWTVLERGGFLYIEVPNFNWQVNALVSGEIGDWTLVDLVFGSQDYEGNYHKAAFTNTLLIDVLEQAGFERIQIQDIGMVYCCMAWKPQ